EIFFANAASFRDHIRELVGGEPSIREVIVDAAAITHIDSTALDLIGELQRELARHDVELVFARLKGPVHDALRRAEAAGAITPLRRFPTLRSAVSDFLGTDSDAS
ncbi:MAG: sodium-independent anion transporter, partial [Gaiellaceae bacterium]